MENKTTTTEYTLKSIHEEYINISKTIELSKDSNTKIILKYSNLDDYTNSENIVNISSILTIEEYFNKEFYKVDENKLECIKTCKDKYSLSYFRHIRGDGNCYYRSITFQLLERLILIVNENTKEEDK